MQKITLQFLSDNELRHFSDTINSSSVEINLRNRTIICEVDDSEISLAITAFNATVVEEMGHI